MCENLTAIRNYNKNERFLTVVRRKKFMNSVVYLISPEAITNQKSQALP